MGPITFDRTQVDKNRDGRIEDAEWNQWIEANKSRLNDDATVRYRDGDLKWKDFQTLKNSIVGPAEVRGQGQDAEGLQDLRAKLAALDGQIDDLTEQVETLRNVPENEADAARQLREAKLHAVQQNLRAIQNKQKQQIRQFEQLAARDGKNNDLSAKMYQNAGMRTPSGKAQTMSGTADVPAGKAQTTGDASTSGAQQQGAAQPKASTETAKGGAWGGMPSNWGAQTMSGPKLNTAAYAQSLFMEDQVMGAWDGINANKNRGQELMRVLFYFMRMAMSGDLMAMYQMMKAVLYIISKDKALQQVHMANKLIELQDASRRATDKLLNFTTDPNDPNSQTEFTKMLQSSKAESDSIATSQKLIASMMEEMAQIVETLTNTTKGALEAAGRVMRTVSRFS